VKLIRFLSSAVLLNRSTCVASARRKSCTGALIHPRRVLPQESNGEEVLSIVSAQFGRWQLREALDTNLEK
jgi:hypothetical protein